MGRALGLLGRELGRTVLDRVAPASGVPRQAGELTPASMSQMIGRTVTSCQAVDGSSGTTDRSVLRLVGDDVPETVFVKTAATSTGTRLFGGLARLGEVEVGFYRDLRPVLGLEAPQVWGSRFDRRTGRFVLVLEDLTPRGATFADTTTPLTVDQVAAVLSTLAGLHAGSALSATRPSWLVANAEDPLLPLVSAALPRLVRTVADRDPTLVAAGGPGLLARYRRWAEVLDRGSFCVLHGDPHPGNVYFMRERAGLLDWQAVRWGDGLRDVAYALVLGTATEMRRAAERDLLEHYCGELASAGGPRIAPGPAWNSYRALVAYAYVSATFTSGLGGLQGEHIADEGLHRAVAAVEDLGSVRLLS